MKTVTRYVVPRVRILPLTKPVGVGKLYRWIQAKATTCADLCRCSCTSGWVDRRADDGDPT